jgi:hypothetical protein
MLKTGFWKQGRFLVSPVFREMQGGKTNCNRIETVEFYCLFTSQHNDGVIYLQSLRRNKF